MMKARLCLVLLTVLMAATRVSSQSDCTNVLFGMVPCLDYITGNSSSPSQQCCNQLANVVRSSPECLCQVLKGGGPQIGIDFNQTQALALPKACNVQTPPVSRCNDDDSVHSPGGSSNTSGKGINLYGEQGNGSKTVPGAGSSSDGSSIKFPFPLHSIIFVASYITIYSMY